MMTTAIFLLNYFVIVFLSFLAVAILLVVRTDKSVSTKLMQIAAILIVPLVFAVYCITLLNKTEGYHQPTFFGSSLRRVLEDGSIPDEEIVAAFAADPEKTADNLYALLPKADPPEVVEQEEAEIAADELEKSPAPTFWHTFPRSDGPADYSKTPEFSDWVQREKRSIAKYWDGNRGVVVTGQLKVEGADDCSGVASRAVILPNGVFVHAIHPDRKRELQFFKSGYEPLAIWLDPRKRYPAVRDLGVVTLKKAVKTASVEFRLKLPKEVDAASIELRNDWPAPTWRDWGHHCDAPLFKTAAKLRAADGETVKLAELSAIPYTLTVTAPGCVRRVFHFTGGKVSELGEIALNRTRIQTFRLREFSGGEWQSVSLELDGTTSLVVAPKDELGNTVDVALTPDRDSPRVLANFVWRPVYYDDYGAIPPETSPLPEPRRRGGRIFLEPGHLYRMQSEMKKVDKLIYLVPGN